MENEKGCANKAHPFYQLFQWLDFGLRLGPDGQV